MSLSSWLMPFISQRLLSPTRLQHQRAKQEAVRRQRGAAHVVHYFHQVDDPYSLLSAACLQKLAQRYHIQLMPHVVSPPADAAAPERDKLIAYSRRDAQLLARQYGLDFRDPGHQPAPSICAQVTAQLVSAIEQNCFVAQAYSLSRILWQGAPDANQQRDASHALPALAQPLAAPEAVRTHIAAADALREKCGHYLGATFYYAGEWYWGIDRLHYLERRLQDVGAQAAGVSDVLFAPPPVRTSLTATVSTAVSSSVSSSASSASSASSTSSSASSPAAIDFFFSLRSPYSAIVTPRIFELGRITGRKIRLRFVLPMVMRGLPVPLNKRRYIALDTAREAREQGIPFGCINDPVGRPTERGLALIPFAEQAGKGQDYLLSFMQGVWAEGIDAGSDRGLRKIVERAGLSWPDARMALKEDAWRLTAEQNRTAMFALGLWGVPSFQVHDTAVWGQDRLWAIADALQDQHPT